MYWDMVFFCNRPALSSDEALGFTTRSLHQCCRAQYSHPIYRVAGKANLDSCLQRVPMLVVQWVLPRRSNPRVQGFKDSTSMH